MSYGIRYLAVNGWQVDQTGDYETMADAEAAVRIADMVHRGVRHEVYEMAEVRGARSGRSAQARKTTGPRANG